MTTDKTTDKSTGPRPTGPIPMPADDPATRAAAQPDGPIPMPADDPSTS